MNFIVPDEVDFVIDMLQRSGYEAYLVGGAVRDLIMGNTPKDFDITTNAKVNDIQNIFKDYNQFSNGGFDHGTVSIIINEMTLEITTYRGDDATLLSDLAKRDFTINSLAYNKMRGLIGIKEGENLIGFDDINYKVIRCVNSPVDRFNEDPLRILRALRLAVTLDFNIETFTKKMMFYYKDLLHDVAIERIREEFNRIIVSPNAYKFLHEYREIIAVFIPEIEDMFDFDQKNKYHPHDLYTHTVNVVAGVKPELEVKLAAFFHDIGKPRSVVYDKDLGASYYHYYNHPKVGAEMTKDILKRLKMPKIVVDDVYLLVLYHDYDFSLSLKNTKRLLYKLGANSNELFLKLIDLKRSDYQDHVGIEKFIVDLDKVVENYEKIIKEKECFKIKDLAINGDVIVGFGYHGEEIGKKLVQILNLVIDGKINNTKEDIINYLNSEKEEDKNV